MRKKKLCNRLESVPVIGLGIGYGGYLERLSVDRKTHVEALKYGVDSGMTSINMADKYGLVGGKSSSIHFSAPAKGSCGVGYRGQFSADCNGRRICKQIPNI